MKNNKTVEHKEPERYVPPALVMLGDLSKLTFGGGSKPPNDQYNPKVSVACEGPPDTTSDDRE